MRSGVVLFDDAIRKKAKDRKKLPSDGWASIDGGDAFRIKSITELQSDVRWWTNLEFKDFFGNQLARHPNFFYSGFLRTELNPIADEIGANLELVSVNQSAQLLSTLFSRVMYLSQELVGVTFSKMGMTTLNQFMGAQVENRNKIPDDINRAFYQAYQTNTKCITGRKRDWLNVTLRRPRYQHAIDVLSTQVPSEHRWLYINRERLPVKTNAQIIDWIVSHEMPILTNVVVKTKRGDFSEIISYASGASVERAWVSQPELFWISNFCEVEVLGAFLCEEGWEQQKELDSFPTLGDFSHASYSLGLLAENFWVNMASPRQTNMKQSFYAPRAIWYRSTDRFNMFLIASKLHKAKFSVGGYGTGAVWLQYPPGATQDMIDFAGELHLDIPIGKYSELRNENRLKKDEH